ncbi:MAG: phosphatidate cytidylyltransferase [Hyphomonadaceae bacterium]
MAALEAKSLVSVSDTKRTAGGKEVVLRVAAAAVLAPLGLWVVYAGGLPLLIATSLCAAVAAIEWTRMASRVTAKWPSIALYLVMTTGAVLATLAGARDLASVALVALAMSALVGWLTYLLQGATVSMMFGALYVSLPFGAFVWIRELDPAGRQHLLAILGVVWATDIAAYFAGRGFGGPLLSPQDSPNKTWTGAIGAVVCAMLAGVAIGRVVGGELSSWMIASFVLSIVAQAGDLLESRFKRMYGVKDTSGVIPGHGGVLDRLDALMAGTLVAALFLRFMPGLPRRPSRLGDEDGPGACIHSWSDRLRRRIDARRCDSPAERRPQIPGCRPHGQHQRRGAGRSR